MRVLVVDHYDSFTWNLVQRLEEAGAECVVRRCDEIDEAGVERLRADRIVLSPGPFGPERTAASGRIVHAWAKRVPILGVCLGMQVIARVGGAVVAPTGRPVHGKSRRLVHHGGPLYRGVPSPFEAALYHSLGVQVGETNGSLQVTARGEDGSVMGVRLRGTLAEGVLFHPESFLTPEGPRILRNFLRRERAA